MALLNSNFLSTLQSVRQRYIDYLSREVCSDVSEHDDMFVAGGLEHYLSVGRSAIDLIAAAMISVQKTRFAAILDLPCGGGRVTRHLQAFLPDSQLFVGDLNKQKEAFVVAKFAATSINPQADFSVAASNRFDLIFVGSLVTHVGANQYERAIRWFIDALAPDGLLVFTTHGRRTLHLFRATFYSGEWQENMRGYSDSGFAYRPYDPAMPPDGAQSYGTSLSAPSWVARLIESEPGVRILNLSEGAWANNQDVVVLQKRPIVSG
ncbi:MAG TPA: class I SAM-dependent methyltransferase [Stellaceae bacterium]|nr:class I SAM-dependent methyltransferase [Stellaceae bacterium]